MPEPKRINIATTHGLALLEEIQELLTEIRDDHNPFIIFPESGRDLDPDKDARAFKAEIARELLRTAELAGILQGELHMQYWRLKGYDDPRRRK
jgi:hypothetical protein